MTLRVVPPRLPALQRVSRRRLEDHGVFAVEESHWAHGQRGRMGPFFTFTCPDWCNVLAVTEKRELALVWQYRVGTETMSLELPGGVIDPGETPSDAARRELREETGYEAPHFEPLSQVHPNPALQGNLCHSFIARDAKLAGPVSFDANEECELLLVPLSQAKDLLAEPYFTHALCVAALQAFLLREGL